MGDFKLEHFRRQMFIKSNQIFLTKLWNESSGFSYEKHIFKTIVKRKERKKERFDQNVLQAAAQAAQSSYLQGLPVGYPNFGATYPQGYIGYTPLIHPDDHYHNANLFFCLVKILHISRNLWWNLSWWSEWLLQWWCWGWKYCCSDDVCGRP